MDQTTFHLDTRAVVGSSSPLTRRGRYNRWAEALSPRRRLAMELGLLALVALAARAIQFGNPAIQVDEQFYLLVGDRMLRGALPYVDIWDRKPIGLFLLYAGIRLLGGVGIIQYQLVATGFALATALLVTRAAGRTARPAGALAAGILYLLTLDVFGGDGGQAPVFFNLPMAAAGVLIASLSARPHFGRRAGLLGCLAMALAGLAIQIKTSAVLESGFFGLALIVIAHDRGLGPRAITGWALAWAALALAPTAAALATYASMHQAPAFLFANVQSILMRGHPAGSAWARLSHIVLLLLPLGAAAATARGVHPDEPTRHRHLFFQAWAIAACLAVLVFGDYFDHYALPLLAPLALAAAPALDDRGPPLRLAGRRLAIPWGALALATAAVAAVCIVADNRSARGTGPEQAAIAAYVRPRLAGRCLFVFDGEPILYHLTGSCLPTRWPFPDHLNNISERGAIGVDARAEVTRIMATKPPFVVIGDRPSAKTDWATRSIVTASLARDYRPVLAVPEGRRRRILFQRVAS